MAHSKLRSSLLKATSADRPYQRSCTKPLSFRPGAVLAPRTKQVAGYDEVQVAMVKSVCATGLQAAPSQS